MTVIFPRWLLHYPWSQLGSEDWKVKIRPLQCGHAWISRRLLRQYGLSPISELASSSKINFRHEYGCNSTRTLSDSLAKKTDPFPTPRVPFFFLPFLSTSETGHVWILSALAFVEVEATLSAGS